MLDVHPGADGMRAWGLFAWAYAHGRGALADLRLARIAAMPDGDDVLEDIAIIEAALREGAQARAAAEQERERVNAAWERREKIPAPHGGYSWRR